MFQLGFFDHQRASHVLLGVMIGLTLAFVWRVVVGV